MSDGLWTPRRTAAELKKLAESAERVAQRDGDARGLRYALSAMRSVADAIVTPLWLQATSNENRKWIEDDARPPDAEKLSDAFARLYKDRFEQQLDTYDAGDAICALHAVYGTRRENDDARLHAFATYVVTISCFGDSSIHEIPEEVVVLWSRMREDLRAVFGGNEPNYSDPTEGDQI